MFMSHYATEVCKCPEIFGITVQVANPDNTSLSSNDITIAAAGRE